jgi:dipeptidyl aminopeptidase/acylaminoacyl peptidase
VHSELRDAVPLSQSVALFSALRGAGKQAALLEYPAADSGRAEAQRLDAAQRVLEFLDHFLRGAPVPAWLTP